MGDRALIQLKSASGDFSPVLYTHWSGSVVADILERAQAVMKGRANDLDYAFARLVVAAVNGQSGNTGFGVFNAEHILKPADSHGDAGCFVVDITTDTWKVQQGGGYGLEGEHKFEVTDLAEAVAA